MLCRKRLGSRGHHLVEITVQLGRPLRHELRCLCRRGPPQEESEGAVCIRKCLNECKSLLLGFDIVKIRKPSEIRAQMLVIQRLLETFPTKILRFLVAL